MSERMYYNLLILAKGGEVSLREIQDAKFISELISVLRDNRIRFNVKYIGRGMHVNYIFKIDGRCHRRLDKIVSSCLPEQKY